MRFPASALIATSAILLLLFSGFSLLSAAFIIAGTALMIIADWKGHRTISLAGYFLLVCSAVNSIGSQGLTTVVDLVTIGFFLVFPLSIALMCALTTGSQQDSGGKFRLTPFAKAATLASAVIVSVPLMGILIASSRFATDVGIESEIMLLGFSTAIMSIIFLGRDSDKR